MEQMSLRTQSALDVTEDALQEISSQVNKLVSEYIATISARPVRAELDRTHNCVCVFLVSGFVRMAEVSADAN